MTERIQVLMDVHICPNQSLWGYRIELGPESVVRTAQLDLDTRQEARPTADLVGLVVLMRVLRLLRKLGLAQQPLQLVTNVPRIPVVIQQGQLELMAQQHFPSQDRQTEYWQLIYTELQHFADCRIDWQPSAHQTVSWLAQTTLTPFQPGN